MRAGGGKQKGASFERWCCTWLSLWVSNGERKDLYWRSAMSGGRATVQNRMTEAQLEAYKREWEMEHKGKQFPGLVNLSQLGDITCVDSKGEWLTNTFIVECKHYKNLEFDSFLLRNTGPLSKFWTKLLADCKRSDKLPLLIARQDRWPPFFITDYTGVKTLSNARLGKVIPVVSSNQGQIVRLELRGDYDIK